MWIASCGASTADRGWEHDGHKRYQQSEEERRQEWWRRWHLVLGFHRPALLYYLHTHSGTFWLVILAFAKAVIWPAFVVYHVLQLPT
jgi:hypothetical protein